MIRSKQHLVVCGSVTLAVALLAMESWWLHTACRAEALAERTLAQKQQEWRALAARQRVPTGAPAANAAASSSQAEDDLVALEEVLRRLESTMDASLGKTAVPPSSRVEAFFDLAEFCRGLHENAGRAGVKISADEAFGFSSYVQAGPDPGIIPAIHRQRRIVERLLDALWSSRPTGLTAVQRERPRGWAANGAAAPSGKNMAEADLFTVDPCFSLRETGVMETTGFRLTFLGQTPALRCFLNQLAQDDIPWVVRSVEVEPVKGPPERAAGLSAGTEPLAVLVRPGLSRFSVTVEFCEPVSVTPRPAAKPAATTKTREPGSAVHLWSGPVPQPRGPGWIYDLFTPPSVYYDRTAGRLSAVPAGGATEDDTTRPRLDLELLEIHSGLFRLQLVGFAGEPESLRGIFLDSGTGETVVGHPGERLAGLGLTVKSVRMERGNAGGVTTDDTRAIEAAAVVVDEGTGENLILTSREPCRKGPPLGLFASRKSPDFRCELQAGESVTVDGVSYCVERIELETQKAVVAYLPPGEKEPLVRTLSAKHTPTGKTAEDSPRS